MTFWGGSIAEGGLERAGRGNGVEIEGREPSLCPLRDFRSDFIKYLAWSWMFAKNRLGR